MSILTHAIASAYGLYDSEDPEGSSGFKVLVECMLEKPIGADWGCYLTNFKLQSSGPYEKQEELDRGLLALVIGARK